MIKAPSSGLLYSNGQWMQVVRSDTKPTPIGEYSLSKSQIDEMMLIEGRDKPIKTVQQLLRAEAEQNYTTTSNPLTQNSAAINNRAFESPERKLKRIKESNAEQLKEQKHVRRIVAETKRFRRNRRRDLLKTIAMNSRIPPITCEIRDNEPKQSIDIKPPVLISSRQPIQMYRNVSSTDSMETFQPTTRLQSVSGHTNLPTVYSNGSPPLDDVTNSETVGNFVITYLN